MAAVMTQDRIVSQNFIDRLMKDIKRYDILYICAPFGWGNRDILNTLWEQISSKDAYWLEETDKESLEQQTKNAVNQKKGIYVIPNLEAVVENGQENLIWELLAKKKKGDVFVIASHALLPAKMLPYTILNKYISYGIEDVKPSCEDVSSYMKSQGILLGKEELLRIERDCENLPLYIKLLANILSGTSKGYTRGVKEQCFEDLFTYIDVMFFRGFSEEDQNAMLKLSCLEKFDNRLIAYMLGIPQKEADSLVERLLIRSSVLQKEGNNWSYYPMFRRFLERVIYKYLDMDERMEDYRRALSYLLESKKWIRALRFAYILQDHEEMAKCLDALIAEQMDYSDLVDLEECFRALPLDMYVRYPRLIIAGSILKAIVGDVDASQKYEKLYIQLIEKEENEEIRKQMQARLLFMYMSRPGMMKTDVLEICTELLEKLGPKAQFDEQYKFEPHYISVLRGEKDYCRYFPLDGSEEHVLEKLHEVADRMSDRTFSIMLKFMEAEVLYERNELDAALNGLVNTTREAKYANNQRMQMLCTLAMIDLLASKNQMSGGETFQLEKIEEDTRKMPLLRQNCQAQTVYYCMLKDQRDEVVRWMKESAPDGSTNFYTTQYFQYLIKAKVLIWFGEYVRARIILQMLFSYAKQYHMPYLEAQVRILEAVVYYREGNGMWKETLIPALEWAKGLGFVRIFADEGGAVYELLSRVASEEKSWEKDEFLKKVITASKAHMLQYPKYLKQEQSGEIGEFSNSEKSVMSLLVLGEKNSEIAERLCVSENTVKYHLKNIYQKLQVKSRSQAVAKIREYQIL